MTHEREDTGKTYPASTAMTDWSTSLLVEAFQDLAIKDPNKRSKIGALADEPSVSRWLSEDSNRTIEALLREAVDRCFESEPALQSIYEKVSSSLHVGRKLSWLDQRPPPKQAKDSIIATPIQLGLASLRLHCFDSRDSFASLSLLFGLPARDSTLKRLSWRAVESVVRDQVNAILNPPYFDVQLLRKKSIYLQDGAVRVENYVEIQVADTGAFKLNGVLHTLPEFLGYDTKPDIQVDESTDSAGPSIQTRILSPTHFRASSSAFKSQAEDSYTDGPQLARWILNIKIEPTQDRDIHAGEIIRYEYTLLMRDYRREVQDQAFYILSAAHGPMKRVQLAVHADDSYEFEKLPEFSQSRFPFREYFVAETTPNIEVYDTSTHDFLASGINVTGALRVKWRGHFR